MKEEILKNIHNILNTLDQGITVTGAKNAGNLAACYMALSVIADKLSTCDVISPPDNSVGENS